MQLHHQLHVNFNYLGVEAANLHELHEPFLRLVKEWSVDGAHTAKTWYGCNGWVGHHNCDLWRNACPSGGNAAFAMFPAAAAWVCQDFWESYAFSLDREWLLANWPTIRGACEFYLDFMIKDPKTNFMVVAPDLNFENGHNCGGSMTMGSTPTTMMVRQLFANAIATTRILDSDADLRAKLEVVMPQLPPTRVDPANGELMEYIDAGMIVANRSACELLSAWGAIWCDQLTPSRTPELCAALRKAYEAPERRPWVTGQVGSWQGAFPANTFARFGDGNRVAEILTKHFEGIVHPNFTADLIESEWEIDGNLGVMAAIGNMLLQSHELKGYASDGTPEYTLELLPALPTGPAWANGQVRGLKARGNITVNITWKNRKVVNCHLTSPQPRPVSVRINGGVKTILPDKS
jgi:alpha-L-fucosidase 2